MNMINTIAVAKDGIKTMLWFYIVVFLTGMLVGVLIDSFLND